MTIEDVISHKIHAPALVGGGPSGRSKRCAADARRVGFLRLGLSPSSLTNAVCLLVIDDLAFIAVRRLNAPDTNRIRASAISFIRAR